MAKQSPGLWGNAGILTVGYPEPISMDMRRQILNTALQGYLNRVNGRVVKVSSEGMVVEYTTKGINHILHLLLTLCTLGFWVIPWIIMSVASNNLVKVMVQVDDYGTVVVVPMSAKKFLRDGRP